MALGYIVMTSLCSSTKVRQLDKVPIEQVAWRYHGL